MAALLRVTRRRVRAAGGSAPGELWPRELGPGARTLGLERGGLSLLSQTEAPLQAPQLQGSMFCDPGGLGPGLPPPPPSCAHSPAAPTGRRGGELAPLGGSRCCHFG